MPISQTDSGSLMEQLSGMPAETKRGKLRIYLGYAAGVGKTYAMLTDAHEAKKNGIDVVVGYIEPHTKTETTALLKGLQILPPLEIINKGSGLKEFDLDGAMKRKPKLILVDELAHTNAQGCRHKKRYQDVEELLRLGIDVYTTVNVQHIESLNDTVAAITGITVRERIPDSVFSGADQIEYVDIEPDDVIDRFHKGKIYSEEKENKALEDFFTRERLTALRQIALLAVANQINRATVSNNEPLKSESSYPGEHILVCLSSAPSNAKVIRAAARMAEALHGVFTALFVETRETQKLPDADKAELRENIRLAEQLGAQIATVYGEDISAQISEYAKMSHVSKLVIGHSGYRKKWPGQTNFVDKLTSLAPNLDIYIIPQTQPASHLKKTWFINPAELSVGDTLKSLGILVLCTLIGLWFDSLSFSEANIITVYILGVLLCSAVTRGRIYSAVSSIISVLALNYFFTYPRFSFEAKHPDYPVTFLVMLLAALITSTMTMRVKEQAQRAAQKAYRTEVLLETNRKLQQAKGQSEIISETAQQLVKLLDKTVIFYAAADNTLSDPVVFPKNDWSLDPELYIAKDERAVAEWVYKNNKRAGATTNTLSTAKCLYLAVRAKDEVFAVAGIAIEKEQPLEMFEKSLMIAMLGECALALEKEKLNETQKQVSMKIQQEQLRANLLRAISHDLRTPLTSISGNAGVLMGSSILLSEEQKKSLYTDIYDDSMWLINLVENLLSITRIDNGAMSLTLQPELLEEVIAESMLHINRKSAEHSIETVVDDAFLMAKVDSRLIMQVLINIVNNAIQYTPQGSRIIVSARREKEMVLVEVSDDGPGIPDEAKLKLFNMFYTAEKARGDGRRGLGLGLALCKSIVEAHGGKIYVRDNIPHGTVFCFTLQAEEVDIHE